MRSFLCDGAFAFFMSRARMAAETRMRGAHLRFALAQ
jgi:hypothetical protein